MDRNNTVTVITKALVLGFLVLFSVLPAAAQSMIPEDFDWSVYIPEWEQDWNSGSWGNTQPQYYDQQPFTYDWYGQSYELYSPAPTPVPQYDPYQNSYGTGYGDYAPQTGYDGGSGEWGYGGQQPYDENGDQWFYQLEGDYYDEFGEWNGYSTPIQDSAYIEGFTGYAQTYNLDCEARSAIDLAAFFGVNINHTDFLNRLPKSDDPNEGFVGNYTDLRGRIPPSSYGVYEEPVAALLRSYGLNAYGAYAYSENALKSQISSGRPVMVWVVGNTELGYPVSYTAASTGRTTAVVPYQHTVVVIGYDDNGVLIQDGQMKYSRDWNTFLLSWGVLGNRAIYVN